MKTDCTGLLERHSALEQRLGAELHSLYACQEEFDGMYSVEIRGELRTANGDRLAQALEIIASAFDSQDRIIATTAHWVDEENFVGFDVFDMNLFDLPAVPSRIRLTLKPV